MSGPHSHVRSEVVHALCIGTPRSDPLWRNVIGRVLRRERLGQGRTLKDVADTARISMPYLSEVERGLKEASSEVLAAAAAALGLDLAALLDHARRELVRPQWEPRPIPITAARELSSHLGRPAGCETDDRDSTTDDTYAGTELSATVELSSARDLAKEHACVVVLLAA